MLQVKGWQPASLLPKKAVHAAFRHPPQEPLSSHRGHARALLLHFPPGAALLCLGQQVSSIFTLKTLDLPKKAVSPHRGNSGALLLHQPPEAALLRLGQQVSFAQTSLLPDVVHVTITSQHLLSHAPPTWGSPYVPGTAGELHLDPNRPACTKGGCSPGCGTIGAPILHLPPVAALLCLGQQASPDPRLVYCTSQPHASICCHI